MDFMTGGESDALECRDRCLAALVSEADFETAQALWRAAGRYNMRNRIERAGRLEITSPLSHAACGEQAGVLARDVNF
jgi:hypothetical protein